MSTRTPGRPSGVSLGTSARSMPASQPQPITEVAKPVIVSAACRAQRAESAVMTTAVARMPNASAKVSSIRMPLMVSARIERARRVAAGRSHARAP
jgi:hypothetical protein